MDGKVIIGTELNTKSFDAQIKQLESKLELLEKSADETNIPEKFRRSADEARELNAEIEKTRNQLSGLYEKQAKINNQGFANMKQSLDNIGNSITGITKKVIKWGLAVFGIRSIYMGIRQAVSQIMQEDENLKYQVEYIKWSIGQAIKPIVEFIVGLVYKIVAGVGALIKLIFGVNIFAKATANNFKKAQGSAQKLRKTIAGFDDLDIINDNGTTGIGGAIDKALEGFGDINKEVDNIAHKIKLWFYGGDYENFWEAIVGNLKKMPETVKGVLQPLWDKVVYPYLVKPIVDGWNNYVVPVFMEFKEITRPIWEPIKNAFIDMVNNYLIPTWNNFKDFASEKIEELRPIWQPVLDGFNETKNNLLRVFAPFLNALIDGFNHVFGWLGWHLDYIEVDAEETGNTITEEVGGSLEDINNTSLFDKWFTINIDANTSEAEKETNNWLSDLWSGIQNVASYVGSGFSNIGSSVSGVWHRIFGAKGMIYNPPKLAVGGIINQPGRGVPLGSAYGGERGMEGVIPLTDSQQMELLGEAIGKYISINATVPVYVGNRQIAREIRRINAEDDFAFNK